MLLYNDNLTPHEIHHIFTKLCAYWGKYYFAIIYPEFPPTTFSLEVIAKPVDDLFAPGTFKIVAANPNLADVEVHLGLGDLMRTFNLYKEDSTYPKQNYFPHSIFRLLIDTVRYDFIHPGTISALAMEEELLAMKEEFSIYL